MPTQRQIMHGHREDMRNGGEDEFLDHGLPVVDREYHQVTASPRGNPQTDSGDVDRGRSKLERIVGN